ncbi:MAG: polysaccharide deacetylase family protein [Candidatus Rokuibacteriota bacterium]
MEFEERVRYSPIIDRPPFTLPGGARVAVWVIVNVEMWDVKAPLPRTLAPAPGGAAVVPDIPNYTWYDYGLRVGLWRIKGILDRHGIKGTLSLNGLCCDTHPRIVEACARADWEMLAHGWLQRVLHAEKDEREVIRRTIQRIQKFTGQRPRGWMGPGLQETWQTPDLLAEEGIEYVADYVNDDEPYPLTVKTGSLVALPYTVELNDIPVHIIQNQGSSGLSDRARAEFDVLYEEGKERAKVMCISMHPYISGVAHRAYFLDKLLADLRARPGVVFWRGFEILDAYQAFSRGVRA